jgi:hypothetical protein
MPISVLAGGIAVAFLCLAVIQLVSGSPRARASRRTPLWGPVTPSVLVFLLATVSWTF